MHEYSFTESLLSLALTKAKEAGAEKISRINIISGEISGIVDECVQQYFDILKQNTLARDAVLAFEKKPLLLKCRNCSR
jgi:hydrogenase nickel incorporation protein HypA/HybF